MPRFTFRLAFPHLSSRASPLIAGITLTALLCASATWWTLQWLRPPQRALAAAPTPNAQPDLAAAAQLFGRTGAVASNYQLKGIVLAQDDSDSVAILSADGKPARAVKIGSELNPGVSLQEIRADGILLSDNGVQKQVPLPRPPKAQSKPPSLSASPASK